MTWFSCPSSQTAERPLMSKIIILDSVGLRVQRTTGASWWGNLSFIDSFNLSVTTMNPPGLHSRNETRRNLFKIVPAPGFITRRLRPMPRHGSWRKCWKMSWQENTSWRFIETSQGYEIALNAPSTFPEKKMIKKKRHTPAILTHQWELLTLMDPHLHRTVLSTSTSAHTDCKCHEWSKCES